jgi:hypothetical protein
VAPAFVAAHRTRHQLLQRDQLRHQPREARRERSPGRTQLLHQREPSRFTDPVDEPRVPWLGGRLGHQMQPRQHRSYLLVRTPRSRRRRVGLGVPSGGIRWVVERSQVHPLIHAHGHPGRQDRQDTAVGTPHRRGQQHSGLPRAELKVDVRGGLVLGRRHE